MPTNPCVDGLGTPAARWPEGQTFSGAARWTVAQIEAKEPAYLSLLPVPRSLTMARLASYHKYLYFRLN